MKREEALTIWAPTESPWSPWVKGVLFAFLPEEWAEEAPETGTSWRVPGAAGTAVVVELAGAEGVRAGLELARSGYRPVPVYNACPAPFAATRVEARSGPGAVPCAVDVEPIRQALEDQSAVLRELALPPSAPPAFLVDANRQRRRVFGAGQWFDNRSVVREWDFPPAEFLRAQGIREVVLVQAERELPDDLWAVLKAWQDGGLSLARQTAGETWNPQGFRVPRRLFLARWRERLRRWSLPRNETGSFGRFVGYAGG